MSLGMLLLLVSKELEDSELELAFFLFSFFLSFFLFFFFSLFFYFFVSFFLSFFVIVCVEPVGGSYE
jgi:hypothetical protein